MDSKKISVEAIFEFNLDFLQAGIDPFAQLLIADHGFLSFKETPEFLQQIDVFMADVIGVILKIINLGFKNWEIGRASCRERV